jgi:acyl-CoA thioesterase
MSLPSLLAGAEPIEGGFATAIPESWLQGRTCYGGLSAALGLTAAMQAGGALPPLRSAQVSFIGPLSGRVEVRARVLRSGRNAIWIASEISGEGGVGLTATFVFMGPVESALHLNDRPAPAGFLSPEDAPALPGDRGAPFLRNNFDMRFALSRNGPKGADRRPEFCWWVRPKAREGLDPMVALMLSADALPPGVLALLPPTTPVSSMGWQVNLLTPAPATRDGWWLLRSTGDYAEKGCSSQQMEIWNASGEPVVAGMQSVAIFG